MPELNRNRGPMKTDFLFVQPSFLRGMASVLDLGGVLEETGYNYSRSSRQADLRAMQSDWYVIGQDLRNAIGRLEEEELSERA